MAASAIAIPTFGNGRALIATDQTGDVHTLAVTTDAPTSGFAVWGFGSTKYILGSTESDGIHTPCVTTDAADNAIAMWGWNAQKYVLATKAMSTLSNGEAVHAVCVSTDTPDSEIALPSFASGVVVVGTRESDGVHTICVSDAESGDAPQALWEWGNQKVILAADTAGSGPTVVPLVMGLAPPYDPDAQAWFDAVSWGDEDLTQKQAINDFIVALKAGGVWDNWDRLWVTGNRDQVAGMTCLKSLEVMTPVNAPTFTPWEGVAGNGSSSYVNTGYTPSTDAVNLAQNNNCFGLFIRGNTTGSFVIDAGALAGGGVGFEIASRVTGDVAEARTHSTQFTGANTNSSELIYAQRTGATTTAMYRNTTSLFTSNVASGTPLDRAVYLGCANNGGTPQYFSTRQIAMHFMGGALDSGQRTAFVAAVGDLKTALGF